MIGRLKELRALYTAASPTVRKSIDKARSYAEIVRTSSHESTLLQ